MTMVDAARGYLDLGWAIIPVPKGSKIPILEGWQNLRLKHEDLPKHFTNGNNIGFLNGEPSNGRVDVDCDWPEAWRLARGFFRQLAE